MLGFSGLADHAAAIEVISRLRAFYDAVTPEELELLNTDTRQCAHCSVWYTRDEFYEVVSRPSNALVKVLHWEPQTESGTTIYCRHCTHLVPMPQTNSKHPGFVYVALCDGFYKIGHSADVEGRIRNLNRDFKRVELVCAIDVENRYHAVAHLHTLMLHRHVESDLFDLSPDDVRYLEGLAR
jgi:hypothetical protein